MVDKFNVAWLALTYNCNNKCKWCYSSSNSPIPSKSFDESKIEDVLLLFKDIGVKRTILIGGEPTVYSGLEHILDEHLSREIPVGMVTNGRKLSKPDFSKMLKEKGINSLTVSIEGQDAESHDEATQIKGSYKEAISGIYIASDEGIRISTNTVITESNLKDLEKIADSLIDLPISHIGFNICGPCFGSEDKGSPLRPSLAAKEFQKVYDFIKENSKKEVKLVTPIPLCLFDKEYRESFKEEGIVSGGPCQLTSGKNFVLDYNGDVVPCTHLTGYPLFNIYNDRRNVISKLEFIEKMNDKEGVPYQFRKMMGKSASEKCDDGCEEPCSGGCPLFWSVFDPKQEIKGIKTYQ